MVGQDGDGKNFAREEIAARGGKSKAGIRGNILDMLDLSGGHGGAEFALQAGGGKGGAAFGPQADGFERLEFSLRVVQEIDRADLGASVLEQALEQFAAEALDLLLAEHHAGELGGVLLNLHFGLDGRGHGVECGGERAELVLRLIRAAPFQPAVPELLHGRRQRRERRADGLDQERADERGEQQGG